MKLFKSQTPEQSILISQVLGTVFILIGLGCYVLPSYYFFQQLGLYFETGAPFPSSSFPAWAGLPWFAAGAFYWTRARADQRTADLQIQASSQEIPGTLSAAKKSPNRPPVVLILLGGFYLIRFIISLVNPFPQVNQNAPMTEIAMDHIKSKEMRITFDRPQGWHVYQSQYKEGHAVVIHKQPLETRLKNLEDYSFMMILHGGPTALRPPGAMSGAVEKNLAQMFKGFQVLKKEIVLFLGAGAIRMEGSFEKNKNKFRVLSFLLDLDGQSYWAYSIVKHGQEADEKVLEAMLYNVRPIAD